MDSPFTENYASPLPLYNTDKIIAPYWDDVDTRGTGQIFYRQTTDLHLLDRVQRDIQAAYPLSRNVTLTNLFIATWDAVGYYDMQTDKVNYVLLYNIVKTKCFKFMVHMYVIYLPTLLQTTNCA